MSEPYEDKLLRSCKTYLSRWERAEAELWEMRYSHKSLRIVLRDSQKDGNLLIACIDPQYITAPIRWTNSSIVISYRKSLANGYEFSVTDIAAGVEIICGTVEVKENVKI